MYKKRDDYWTHQLAQTDWSTLISSDEDEQAFLDALAELNFEQMIRGKEKYI